MMFLFVLVDFGIAIDRRVVIQHAVREGARQGAVGKSESEIETIVINQSQDVLDATEISICFVDGDDANSYPGNAGDNIRVSANYVYQFGASSGQLLRPLGVDPDDFDIVMNPHGEAMLEGSVTGAIPCPP